MNTGYTLLSFFLITLPLLAFGYNTNDNFKAKVTSLEGTVIAYKNGGKTIQFLKKGDTIFQRLMLVTRDKSNVTLSYPTGEKIVLKSNSKITIHNGLVTLKKGLLKFEDLNGEYQTFKFKFQKFSTLYAGKNFLMGHTTGKPFITPINKERINLATLNRSKSITEDLTVPDISSLIPSAVAPVIKTTPEGEEELPDSRESSSTSEVEDIFGDDDTSAVVSEISIEMDDDGEEELKDLLDINWKFKIRAAYYLSEPPVASKVDDQAFHGDLKINFNDKINISEEHNFFYSGWFEINNRKEVKDSDILSITSRETKKPYLLLNEYYWLKSMDSLDFTIGKKIFRFGKGMLVSPVDRISPSDSIVPSDSERIGAFIVSLDYYLGDSKFTFLWVPYQNTSKSPHPFSRWSTRTDGNNFDITSVYPSGFGIKSTQTLTKFETTFKGVDLFVALFNGANTDPIITNDIVTNGNTPDFTIKQEFVPVTNISTGISTTFGGLEVHGEALRQNAAEGKDDAYTQYMGGFRYSFDEWPEAIGLDQIDVIIEYVKENIDQQISFPFILFSSTQSRVFKNNFLGTINFQVHDKLSYNFGFNIDNEGSGQAFLLGMGYRYLNAGRLSIRLESYSGEQTSIFGVWENNDNLAVEYSIDF